MSWMQRAACADAPADIFFDERALRPEVRFAAAAAVCARCPVRPECLDAALPHALDRSWDLTFRASTTAAERRRIRRGTLRREDVWARWDRLALQEAT